MLTKLSSPPLVSMGQGNCRRFDTSLAVLKVNMCAIKSARFLKVEKKLFAQERDGSELHCLNLVTQSMFGKCP
jgi:hypothetical protein